MEYIYKIELYETDDFQIFRGTVKELFQYLETIKYLHVFEVNENYEEIEQVC